MKIISLVKSPIKNSLWTVVMSLSVMFANSSSAGEIYEAETAGSIHGAKTIIGSEEGYSGTGFVDYQNADNDYIEWNIKLPQAGYYEFEFQYALASGNRPLEIKVNGKKLENLNFTATGSFATWQRTKPLAVKLNAGINHIRATAIGSSGGNLDYLSLTKVTDPNKDDTISPDGAKHKSITLNNGKIIFNVNKSNAKQAVLSYQINDKNYPAVKLIPELTGAKRAKVRFTVVKAPDKSQRGLLLITAGRRHGSLQFGLDRKAKCLKLSKLTGIAKLTLKFSSVALVIPEQNSEDLVIYPADWKQTQVNIPSDNHLIVNMIDRGNAMISCIWNNSQIKLVQHKTAAGKRFGGLDLMPQKGDILWVGIDAAPQIWTQPQEAISKKSTKLSWHPPFKAKWFVTLKKQKSDIAAENNLFDSWVLADLNVAKPTAYTPGIFIVNQDGRVFSAEIGMYSYPFVQKKNDIFLFYPFCRKDTNSYDNSFMPLIYPLKATNATKKHKMLPYDALERVLVGDVLEQLHTVPSPLNRYKATCGRSGQIEKIFYRDEAKKLKRKVVFYCEDMDGFISSNRLRIEEYRVWTKKTADKLRQYVAQHPDAKASIIPLQKILAQVELAFAYATNVIKTPAYFQTLTHKVIVLADSAGDAEAKEQQCKKLGRQIRTIGGRQDHLVGTMRLLIKAFRIKVTLLLLEKQTPQMQKLLKKLRHDAAVLMHTRLVMEGK